ncbi:MAG: DUF4276 family protein [Ignavibacteriales bacterium]|nr:DUF4276 family protein [Ignavibacteriales bacterium]MBK7265936.1 DUF4276 family protein [Ignavibacteriales bacterium]MBP7543757.1 DUF4276 family protein [Ignavibacteriaceae bacterium]MBP9123817.1 DUF4276 family protein [Ignavibacteriaceae bacterium]MCC6637443.1 DUF4276 family protein [Ignavibacteriaceae bacterium]
MKIIEILVEEPSIKNVLNTLLPSLLTPDYKLDENCFVRVHSGKTDLLKSIPRKLKAYSKMPDEYKVLILVDKDFEDCKELKQKIESSIPADVVCDKVIRIVSRELEGWFVGDLVAVEKAYPSTKATKYKNKSTFRDPDEAHAVQELKKIIPGFSKGEVSQKISLHMNLESNRNKSFNQFIKGLEKLIS